MAKRAPTFPPPTILGKGIAPERSDAVFEFCGRPYWLIPAVRDCDADRYERTGLAAFYRLKIYKLLPDRTTASGYRVGRTIWVGPGDARLTELAHQVIAFRRRPSGWVGTFPALTRKFTEIADVESRIGAR